MKQKRQVSRREFMRISAFTTAGAVLVACGGAAPAEAPAAEATMAPAAEGAAEVAVSAGGYSEAPMLAELVAAGTLPPVDERLPENPMVMDVAEGIGNYGGPYAADSRASRIVGGRPNMSTACWSGGTRI